MSDPVRVSGFLTFFAMLVITLIVVMYETKYESRESIVKNTDACFYLDENHKRQFSWSCDDE